MSRYNKMMSAVLDAIFEGYTLDGSGKLVVRNEEASKQAQEHLHTLVLEKARELWDQLEAAEDSLASVAEEIRFEELNTDPSSTATATTHAAVAPEDAAAVDAPPADAEAATALESADSISELLSADDLNLDDIFENMDHLDNHQNTNVPAGPDMPFDEGMGHEMGEMGGMSAGNMASGPMMDDEGDGDEDYDALTVGMGDEAPMGGDPAADEFGAEDDLEGDMGDPDMNGDPDMGDEMNGGDDMGFDFDLDLEDPEGMGDEFGAEEEPVEMMGGDKSMRMEAKGDDDKDDDDDDKDGDDDDDDDKPAFLKKKDD